MAEPYNYLGLMGGTAALDSIPTELQNALLGRQTAQHNQALLDEQQRADAARQAMARVVLRQNGAQPSGAPASAPAMGGGGFVETPEQKAQAAAFQAQFPNAPKYAPDDQTHADPDAADLAIIAQADPAAAQAILRNRQMLADKATMLRDPSAQNIAHFGMAYPDAFKEMKPAWDLLDANQQDAAKRFFSDTYNYLLHGDVEGAAAATQRHIDAEKASGQDTSEEEAFLAAIRRDPKTAQALAGGQLSVAMGPENFAKAFGALGEERRADETQPYKVRQEAATASTKETEAQYAAPKIESDLATAQAQRQKIQADITDQIEGRKLDWAKFGLDQDKLTTETQLRLEELNQKATQADPGSIKIMNDAATNAVQANASADKIQGLADQINASGMHAYGSATEKMKALFGGQDQYTQIRAQYNQLINSEAMKGRQNMPGAMSDADRKFLMQGFPSMNANPEYIAHFLETMAKAQRAVGIMEDRKAQWISANGNLGTARSDLNIGGAQVRAGTSFPQYMGAANKADGAGQLPTGISALQQRYGKR